jgi:hypothetical protein
MAIDISPQFEQDKNHRAEAALVPTHHYRIVQRLVAQVDWQREEG